MISLQRLERIIQDQRKVFLKKKQGVLRNINFAKYKRTKHITVISGIRRSGKSTLMRQFAEHYKNFYYFNFDDERLADFSLKDFDNLMLAFLKQYKAKVIFLDEIQNVERWELFVRRIFEEGYKIFLTGSNAKLLSSELSTRLTGRYLKIELYPFSFVEFLQAKNVSSKVKNTQEEAKILRYFDAYLRNGGFPEFVLYKDKEILQRIYEDILYKDLLVRFKVREIKAFKQLAYYLFSNISKEISYESLRKILNFKNLSTVKNYISHMEEAYLLFELYKYDFSLKKQFVKEKKIYAIDNGLQRTIGFSFSPNKGQLLENAVFLELKRQQKEIYFHKDKKECDFLVVEKNKVKEAIQVTEFLSKQNKEREISALLETMNLFRLKKGLILTKNQNKDIEINNKTIKVRPVWFWVLKK